MDEKEDFKEFLEEVQQINASINEANNMCTHMSFLKSNRRNELSGEKSADLRKTNELSKNFQMQTDKIRKSIKDLQEKQKTAAPSVDLFLKNTHIRALAERLHKILKGFEREESEAFGKTRRLSGSEETDGESSSQKGDLLPKKEISASDSSKGAQIKNAEKRQEEIFSILSNIEMLEATSDKLSQIIDEASASINTLSYSTYSAAQRSSTANRQIESIIRRKKRIRKMQLIGGAILVVVGSFSILWILKSFRSVVSP